MRERWLFLRKAFRFRRAWNALLSYSSYGLSVLLRRPVVWGLPPVLMVEPTNVCNLKCPLCPTGAGTLKRPSAFLDSALYRRAVDELARDTFMLLLWNQGESFLHPEFLEMVRYADRAGLWTYASTNGHYLDRPEELVRSGLGTLLVSVDGATPETYRAYRRSGDFELVIRGLKELTAAKRRLGSPTPVVHLQFIVMRHNEHEIPEIDRLARECGVDRLTLKTVQIYDDQDIDVWLPEDPERRRYRIVGDGEGKRHFAMKHGVPNRCKRLWNQPVIHAGGEVTVCCFDKDSDYAMGNLARNSFHEIWRAGNFQDFRRTVFRGRERFEMCRNCGEGLRLNLEQRDLDVDLARPLSRSLKADPRGAVEPRELEQRLQAAEASRVGTAGDRNRERRDEAGENDSEAAGARGSAPGSTNGGGVAGMSLGAGPRHSEELEGDGD